MTNKQTGIYLLVATNGIRVWCLVKQVVISHIAAYWGPGLATDQEGTILPQLVGVEGPP